MKEVMCKAWEIAKKAAKKWGGKAIEYIGGALKMAWEAAKGLKEETKINTREIIEKYKITLVPNAETDLIKVSNIKAIKADNMVGFVKEHKKQIVHELKALKGEFIPGLKEIKKAQAEWATWKKDFNASFESEDATPLPKRLGSDLNDLLKKYPQASAYLKMKALSNSADYELSSIGDAALEMVVDGDWEKAIKYASKKESEFANKHLRD